MNRIEELAQNIQIRTLTHEEDSEVVTLLRRLARIEAAVLPEALAPIAQRCADMAVSIQTEAQDKDYARSAFMAPKDRATLLDAVRAQTVTIDTLTSIREQADAENAKLRADVERLSGQVEAQQRTGRAYAAALVEASKAWSDDESWYCLRFDEGIQRMAREHKEVRSEVATLTERLRMSQHGEREALKMMGAARERADRLAEGVRQYRALVAGAFKPAWECLNGHLVTK